MVTFGVLTMYTFTVKRGVHFLVFMDSNDTHCSCKCQYFMLIVFLL